MQAKDRKEGARAEAAGGLWKFNLYVTGTTGKSAITLANLKRICDEYLHARYQIKVVDLLKQPRRAFVDQIIATPTVVKKMPLPTVRVIGDLSNTENLLARIDLKSSPAKREGAQSP